MTFVEKTSVPWPEGALAARVVRFQGSGEGTVALAEAQHALGRVRSVRGSGRGSSAWPALISGAERTPLAAAQKRSAASQVPPTAFLSVLRGASLPFPVALACDLLF